MATKEKSITLTDKLTSIQKELKAPKGQYNKFGNYKYRSCEDILEAVKPLLAMHECAIMLSDELMAVGNRYYIKATATIADKGGELSVTAYAREEETKKGMDGSQITGTASSYARKYALNGLFAIDDTKDADATNTHGKAQTAQPAQAKPQVAQPKPQPAPQQQPQVTPIAQAIAEAYAANTTKEMTAVWRKYACYHTKEEFKTVVTQRGAQLKLQENGGK